MKSFAPLLLALAGLSFLGGVWILVAHSAASAVPVASSNNQTNVQPTAVASTTSQSPLALQAQCASQAEKALKTFEQQMSSGGFQYSGYSEDNNYNPSLNKCFVLISYAPTITPQSSYKDPTNIENLEDAYTGSTLANCYYYANLPGGDPSISMANNDAWHTCFIGSQKVPYATYAAYVVNRLPELAGNQ